MLFLNFLKPKIDLLYYLKILHNHKKNNHTFFKILVTVLNYQATL